MICNQGKDNGVSNKNEQERMVRTVSLEIEVLSQFKHLFNKICEEKMLMEGEEAGSVIARMIYKESCEVFGERKTDKLMDDYFLGISPK